MDLTELARRTRIDRRKLRYVVDHQLIPRLGIKIVGDEVGRPRHFADDVGFAIVCAAQLLELGLGHATIRRFLDGMTQAKFENENKLALVKVLESDDAAFADLADGQWVRLRLDERFTGWVKPNTRQRAQPLWPTTITTLITLNLGQIRTMVVRTGH